MTNVYDIAVVGGGIVGISTAYNIQLAYPKLNILLLEKETEFAQHQTGHNSGVIHSGLYYKPGSKKADYCFRGRNKLIQFAKDHKIDFDICGKVVVACDESDLPFMQNIKKNGIANNLQGIEELDSNQIKEIEPYVESIAGLFVPSTGIINFARVALTMLELIKGINEKSEQLCNQEVIAVADADGHKNIKTSRSVFKANKIIYCGGLQADRLAKIDQVNLKERIVGFRGDYYELTEHAKGKVKNLIYPVPNPKFPFLGVHFTRMIDGDVECGPNAVMTFKREGYSKLDFDFKDTFDALTYSGTWKLLMSNLGFAWGEYRRAFSKKLFLESLQQMIPSLTMDDIKPGRSGVRAQYLGINGDTREDFKIEFMKDSIHVLNAPSPAATASLVIGEEIKNMAEEHFCLNK